MSCCPSRGSGGAAPPAPEPDGTVRCDTRVSLRGSRFEMGTRDIVLPEDGEGPPRRVRIKPFDIAATAVTNAEFAAFVAATGYVTEAEQFGWTYVFMGLLDGPEAHAPLPGLEWWRKVDEAA